MCCVPCKTYYVVETENQETHEFTYLLEAVEWANTYLPKDSYTIRGYRQRFYSYDRA